MKKRPSLYWVLVEQRRRRVKLSRAELARRAGLSESTIYKGLHGGTVPTGTSRQMVELVLTLEEILASDVLPHARAGRRPCAPAGRAKRRDGRSPLRPAAGGAA